MIKQKQIKNTGYTLIRKVNNSENDNNKHSGIEITFKEISIQSTFVEYLSCK